MGYRQHIQITKGSCLALCAFLVLVLAPIDAHAEIWSFTWQQEGESGKHSFSTRDDCRSARSTWINTMRNLGERASAGPCQSSGDGTSTPGATGPSPAELERQELRQEAVRKARAAERKRELGAKKKDTLGALKGVPSGVTVPKLKPKDALTPKPAVAPAVIIAEEQSRLDALDPSWINEVQERTTTAMRARKGEIRRYTQTFETKTPPELVPQPKLGQSKAGDIILVGADDSSLAGVAQGFLQRYAEKKFFGNEAAPVTHALVYLGARAGSKLFLDNQLGEGPRIISETEFRQRYGTRPLFRARPADGPEGNELFKAAYAYAKSNSAATQRGTGLLGTKYGTFGEDNIVCSEAALFSVVQAQSPGKKIVIDNIGGTHRLNPISVTPGDIYNQDGKGVFTVQPLHVD